MSGVGASEFYKLALDLRGAPRKMVRPMRDVFDEGGKISAAEWAKNAKSTSGEHGKHYPNSISHEVKFTLGGNVEVEVGPDASKKQGRMGRGFEFGSRNQPPHLDGVKAFEAIAPRLEKIADAAIGHLIP